VVLQHDIANGPDEPRHADPAVEIRVGERGAHEIQRRTRQQARAVGRRAVAEMEPGVLHQVVRGRDDAADRRRRAREGPWARDRRLLVDDDVPDRDAVRDRLVGRETRPRHAERNEQQLARRVLVALFRNDLDETAEQREARVGVVPDLPQRRELLELGHRGDVALERVVAVAEVREAVAEPPAGVRDEMADRRALLRGRVTQPERRDVAAYRRVEIERAALDEPHDHRRGHRLGDGSDLEERVAVDR
jgi:hypothetical protein